MRIVFDLPGTGVNVATSQHMASQLNASDYFESLENGVLTFSDSEQTITVPFTLLPDDLLEGIEGFRITATSMLPTLYNEPETAFASMLIRILDDDSMFYTVEPPPV